MKTGRKELIVIAIAVFLSVLAMFSKLFVGFDVDEGAMLALAAKLAEGKSMFGDLWDIYQTTGILPAVFLKIYVLLTGGYEASALYLRIVGTLIHLGVSFVLYRTCRKYLPGIAAFLLAALTFNLLPRGMAAPDYTIIQMWGTVLLSCVFLSIQKSSYGKRTENGLVILGGIAYSLAILACPPLGLTFLYFLFLLYRGKKKGVFSGRSFLVFPAACLACAVLFFLYIFHAVSPLEFLESLEGVFSDASHANMSRIQVYLGDMPKLLIRSVPVIAAGTLGGLWIGKKKQMEPWWAAILLINVFYPLFVIFCNFAGRPSGVLGLQVRYLVFAGCSLFVFLKERKNETVKQVFLWMWIPSVFTYIAMLSVSNLGLEENASTLYLAEIAFFIMMYQSAGEVETGKCPIKYRMLLAALGIVCFGHMFYKGYLVRKTGTEPANITETREQIQEGPLKYLWVYPQDADMDSFYREELAAHIGPDETAAILTRNVYVNLYIAGREIEPVNHSTITYDDQWILYFERYPKKAPDVIVVDSGKTGEWEEFRQEHSFEGWISERYQLYQTSQAGETKLYFLRRQ